MKTKLLLCTLVLALLLAALPKAVEAIVPVTVKGFRLQFRADKPHPFGLCERRSVKHFHIELFQSLGNERWKYKSNFHIGVYKSGTSRCYVAWNNYKPALCAKTFGGKSGLTGVLQKAIIAVSIAAGIVIAVGVAAMLATAATGALYPMLVH